jgi:hypothetical protein
MSASPSIHEFDAPRSYLFVSARDPLAAASALWSWGAGPPDLCVTSPSDEAHDTGAFAFAGHSIPMIDEPGLARRQPGENWSDFDARFAEALLIVTAYDTRAALVVCDQFPQDWETPYYVDGDGLLGRAGLLERQLPLQPLD